MTRARTLYDKIWDEHLVSSAEGELPVIYIDRHLVHEVTSPQAFEGLRMAGRTVRHPEKTLAVPDHNVPTDKANRAGGIEGISDPESKLQVQTLAANAAEFGIDHVIFEQKIWTPRNPTWRPMADRGGITANHYDHVHVSVKL